jgi:hypothetical protein
MTLNDFWTKLDSVPIGSKLTGVRFYHNTKNWESVSKAFLELNFRDYDKDYTIILTEEQDVMDNP